jgi:hypothetical protein
MIQNVWRFPDTTSLLRIAPEGDINSLAVIRHNDSAYKNDIRSKRNITSHSQMIQLRIWGGLANLVRKWLTYNVVTTSKRRR